MNLTQTIDLYSYGTANSGCRGPHCGRPKGHSGPHKQKDESKQKRAKSSHVPTSWSNVLLSEQNQNAVAKALKATSVGGQQPFDVIDKNRKIGIEIKTLVNQKSDKLTQHPASWRRKVVEAKKQGLRNIVTIAVDDRPGKNGQIYYRLGLKSSELHMMTKVDNLKHLAREIQKVHESNQFGKDYGSFSIKKRK